MSNINQPTDTKSSDEKPGQSESIPEQDQPKSDVIGKQEDSGEYKGEK